MSKLARKDEEKILSSEFLEEIKRVRELKGVSQEEVSEKTNIKLSYIQAIEAGNIEGLPGGIYNRAYIKSVSEFLGINMKPFERKVVSDEFIDEQKIKLEISSHGFNSQSPNFIILISCFALILVVYSAFYIIGGDDKNSTLQNAVATDGITAVKTSPLNPKIISETGQDFTVSIIAKEQTQVEISDAENNIILSKIFLPNEAIIYPADDKEYFLYTPEIGVLEVYLDGVFVKNMPEMKKEDDRFLFTVDALFDAIKGKTQEAETDEEKTDA